MVSSSGEIEFVSENVTNYLHYSQVSDDEALCVTSQRVLFSRLPASAVTEPA